MNKITTEIVKGVVVLTTIISCFTLSTNLKPKYEEFENITLKSNNSSSVDLGDANLIACYGASGNNSEFYINNVLIEDLSDYVLYKELDFTTSATNAKLKLEKINLSRQDTCNKALKMKVKCGEQWLELDNLSSFKGYEFDTIAKTEVWIWYELSLLTKDEVISSNGTNVQLIFNIEVIENEQ